jgi:hypothetical protein
MVSKKLQNPSRFLSPPQDGIFACKNDFERCGGERNLEGFCNFFETIVGKKLVFEIYSPYNTGMRPALFSMFG